MVKENVAESDEVLKAEARKIQLLFDRTVGPQNKNIVIASINGEQTVKRLPIDGKNIKLMPENSRHKPIEVKKDMDFRTQGVVIWMIRRTG